MSENTMHTPTPERVFVLTDKGTELREGTLERNRGPDIVVRCVHENGGFEDLPVNKADAFSLEQVAAAADDLLPQVKDGEEQILTEAINETMSHAETRQELLGRLAGMATIERFTRERGLADYGVKPVEQMVGNPETKDSNMWKVERLISMSREEPGRNVTKILVLSDPEEDELLYTTDEEANKIRDQIISTNREALDKIYDYYDVSYENRTVYESSEPSGGRIRTSVYPSATESVYFIEEVREQDTTAPNYIRVTNTPPEYNLGNGYMRTE